MTCLTLVWAQPAFADKADAAARKAYRQGKSNFEKGYYEDALAAFRHAYALSPRAKLLYNIGVSADRLDRDEDALEAYEGYLSKLRRPSRAKEVHARVEGFQCFQEFDEDAPRLSCGRFHLYRRQSNQPLAQQQKFRCPDLVDGRSRS